MEGNGKSMDGKCAFGIRGMACRKLRRILCSRSTDRGSLSSGIKSDYSGMKAETRRIRSEEDRAEQARPGKTLPESRVFERELGAAVLRRKTRLRDAASRFFNQRDPLVPLLAFDSRSRSRRVPLRVPLRAPRCPLCAREPKLILDN